MDDRLVASMIVLKPTKNVSRFEMSISTVPPFLLPSFR